MKPKSKLTRWPRTANPVLSAMRRQHAKCLDETMMDIQAAEAMASLRNGQLVGFDAKVLEALTFTVRKLARQGVGREALPCAEHCLALLGALQAGRILSDDQLACFSELVAWGQAQREADQEAFRTAVMPLIR